MSKYEEALKSLSCDVSKLCKEMGWEMDNKDIEVMKELIQVKSDLEAKLAEKEDQINWLVEAEFNRKWAKKYVEMRRKEDPMLCLPDSDEVYEKYFELKQQLAEKDHTINTLIEDHKASQEWYKKQLAEKDDEITQRLVIQERDYNQYKILFALEQLEKVKECLYKIQSPMGEKPTLMDDGDVFEVINNQIKSIKEMK